MNNYELCEKLVEKTGVSYSDAKAALEESGWDMLDAVILLESQGKTRTASASYAAQASGDAAASHGAGSAEFCNADWKEQRRAEHRQLHDQRRREAHSFWGKCKRFVTENRVAAYNNNGKQMLNVPVWVALVVLICLSWLTIALVLVSFVCGWQYRFEGPQLGKNSVNNASAKVGSVVYNVGKDIHSHFDGKAGTVNANYTVNPEEEQQ